MSIFGPQFLEATMLVKFPSGSLWQATLTPRYLKVNVVSMERERSLFFPKPSSQEPPMCPGTMNGHGHPAPWSSGYEVIEAALERVGAETEHLPTQVYGAGSTVH